MKIRMCARVALAASMALLGLTIAPALTASAASATPTWHSHTYTCRGGDVAPGTYSSMIITGVCYMPAGNVVIKRDLTVAPRALLDAVTPGDPTTGTHVVPATVVVGGNVVVGKGAVLLLGCSPNISCGNPPGFTFDRIGGRLLAFGAQGVVLHSAFVRGSMSLLGGGGGKAAQTCAAQSPGKPTIADLKPWSEDPNLDMTPVYSDFEDNSVGGSMTVAGLTSCWLGSLRNQVRGNATYAGNTMGDPDAMEVNNNLIGGSMTCLRNTPTVQFGDGGTAPNLVRRHGIGECGFGVVKLNPAPQAGQGPGVPEHIAVSTRSLRTYHGTRAATTVQQLPPVTTEAGDTLFAELNDIVTTGTGIRTSCKVDPSLPPGQSGEVVLGTAYPDGLSTYEVLETCTFSFHGQSGSATVRAYGTTTRSGANYGTFLIASGGAGHGGLSTLAGWGTFSSAGEPAGSLRLVEHLRIT